KNIGADNFGFSQDLDVAKMEFPTFAEASAGRQEPIETNKETDNIPQINQEETLTPKTKSVKNGKNILISIASSLLTFAKKINIGKIFSKIPRGKITFIIPAILILIFALIVSYLLFIKATIEITIDPKITEQNKNVLISTISRTDPTENIIKGEFVSVSEDGTVLTSATGKKDVGTKAKGAIAILSSLSDETTIKEGSIVTSSNGLQFIIDDNIKIASSSGLDDLKSSKANVTAKDLGKEYNLPSGTKFTIGSFDSSQVVAKNDNPFSGGTKKEVTVVSKTDETKLENDLTKQLEEKAKSELAKQIGQNKVLLPAFISSSLSKETLNVKVGDEATQVTLTGTVEYQGISYDRQDLIAFSKSLLEKDIPSNQEIDYNNIKTAVKDIKNKNDEEINANLNIKALLLPKIDQANLVKNIKGKSFKNAEDLLYKNSQISNVYIYLSPKIPFLPKNLPNSEKNIKILIKING
ncbi:MAG: baseplate J/gp47 family protein, partial [Candidatus Parcubacteria bacterium]|nr:baseplate J/gp47 family protein [Candidatus Parcubacteria bacterium]